MELDPGAISVSDDFYYDLTIIQNLDGLCMSTDSFYTGTNNVINCLFYLD